MIDKRCKEANERVTALVNELREIRALHDDRYQDRARIICAVLDGVRLGLFVTKEALLDVDTKN